jgi:hypothetical protein
MNPLSIFLDDIFYTYRLVVIGNLELTPIYVTGEYGYPWFNGWPGIGPSPAPYKMKAYIDAQGNIYRPPSDYEKRFNRHIIKVSGIPSRAIVISPSSKYHTRTNQTYFSDIEL